LVDGYGPSPPIVIGMLLPLVTSPAKPGSRPVSICFSGSGRLPGPLRESHPRRSRPRPNLGGWLHSGDLVAFEERVFPWDMPSPPLRSDGDAKKKQFHRGYGGEVAKPAPMLPVSQDRLFGSSAARGLIERRASFRPLGVPCPAAIPEFVIGGQSLPGVRQCIRQMFENRVM